MAGRGASLWIVAAVAACVAVAPAAALAGCDWGDIAAEGIQAASIQAGSPRVHFVQDEVVRDGCPNDSAWCQAHAFLTPNDVVLAGSSDNTYTCAGFSNGRGTETIGWLPTATLRLLPEARRRTGVQGTPSEATCLSGGCGAA